MELKDVDVNGADFKVEERKDLKKAAKMQAEGLENIDSSLGDDSFDEEIADQGKKASKDDTVYVKKRGPLFTVMIVLLFLISTTLVAIAILYAGKDIFMQKEAEIEQEELGEQPIYTQTQVDEMIEASVIKAKDEQAKKSEDEAYSHVVEASKQVSGILKLLRDLSPDNVIFTYGSKFEYYPINFDLKPNTIDNANLVVDEETGMITHVVDGKTQSHVLIDVSSFQKEIDWDKVKAAGVDYAIIRCGFRGYGSGKIVEDTYFTSNIEAATSAGIKVGVYFFTQAISVEEAVEEAEYVIDLIKPYEIDLPVAIDIEEINDKARTDDLDNDMRTEYCVAFMDTIKKAGYEPMIYTNLKYFIKMLDMDKLEGYEKWYAFYNTSIYFPYEISIWQYSSSGTVDGIDTGVDMNITFKDW